MAFSRLVQVSNLSTHCTKDQLTTLFSYVGPLEESVIYPEGDTLTSTVGTKVGYVRFTRSDSARIAIHLTNIIFVEKQLVVAYVLDGRIPDEADAIKYCAPLNPNITLIAGGPSWNSTIINRVVGQGINAEIETMDHELNERHLPPYPNLPGSLDHCKAEEIRRTVYISNIDRSVTLEMLEEFVSQIGEVRYIRAAYDTTEEETQDAYVEFAEQHSVPRGLCLNGFFLISRQIEVNHAMIGVSKTTSLTAPISEIVENEGSRHSRSNSRQKRSRSGTRKRHRSRSRNRSRTDSLDRKRPHRPDRSPSYLRKRSPSYHRRNSRYYYYGSNRPRSPPPGYYDRFYGRRRHGFPRVYRRDRSHSRHTDRHCSSLRNDERSRRHLSTKRSQSPSSKRSERRKQSRSAEKERIEVRNDSKIKDSRPSTPKLGRLESQSPKSLSQSKRCQQESQRVPVKNEEDNRLRASRSLSKRKTSKRHSKDSSSRRRLDKSNKTRSRTRENVPPPTKQDDQSSDMSDRCHRDKKSKSSHRGQKTDNDRYESSRGASSGQDRYEFKDDVDRKPSKSRSRKQQLDKHKSRKGSSNSLENRPVRKRSDSSKRKIRQRKDSVERSQKHHSRQRDSKSRSIERSKSVKNGSLQKKKNCKDSDRKRRGNSRNNKEFATSVSKRHPSRSDSSSGDRGKTSSRRENRCRSGSRRARKYGSSEDETRRRSKASLSKDHQLSKQRKIETKNRDRNVGRRRRKSRSASLFSE